jgi:hypothetical protein
MNSAIARNIFAFNVKAMHTETIDPLSTQLDTDGIGGIPSDEVPTRLQSFTLEATSDHDRRRLELLMKLAVIHAKNEKGDGTGFCNHPVV